MPYPTLYPPQVNSPATEIMYAISASGTGLTVPASAILPAVPCPLVIGYDDDAETVLCTMIMPVTVGTTVVEYYLEVRRGFEGVAKAWSAGTPVARNLAAYDIQALQEWVQTNKALTQAALDDAAVAGDMAAAANAAARAVTVNGIPQVVEEGESTGDIPITATDLPTSPIEGLTAQDVQGALAELAGMLQGGTALIKTNITIPMTAWQDATDTTALWFVDIADVDVSENSIVSVFFKAGDVVNGARRAGIIETIDTADGKFTLYAASRPSQDFVVKIKIEKGGD